MTSVYPSQSTPSFLKKYTKSVYNRVQYNAHHDAHHQNMDEAAIDLQVRNQFKKTSNLYGFSQKKKQLFNQ